MFILETESPRLRESLEFAEAFFGETDQSIPMLERSVRLHNLLLVHPEIGSIVDSWRLFLRVPDWTAEEKALRMHLNSLFANAPKALDAQNQINALWGVVVQEASPLPQSPFPEQFSRLGIARATVVRAVGLRHSADGNVAWYPLLEPLDPNVIADENELQKAIQHWESIAARFGTTSAQQSMEPTADQSAQPLSSSADQGDATVSGAYYFQTMKVITPDGKTRTLRVKIPSGQLFSIDMLSKEDLKEIAEMTVGTSKEFIPKKVNTGFINSL